jgi:hypothetical protein
VLLRAGCLSERHHLRATTERQSHALSLHGLAALRTPTRVPRRPRCLAGTGAGVKHTDLAKEIDEGISKGHPFVSF